MRVFAPPPPPPPPPPPLPRWQLQFWASRLVKPINQVVSFLSAGPFARGRRRLLSRPGVLTRKPPPARRDAHQAAERSHAGDEGLHAGAPSALAVGGESLFVWVRQPRPSGQQLALPEREGPSRLGPCGTARLPPERCETFRPAALLCIALPLTLARPPLPARREQELRKHCVIGIVGGSDLVKIKEQLGNDCVTAYDYCFGQNGLEAFKAGEVRRRRRRRRRRRERTGTAFPPCFR
eukprot:SAG22_NODE_467_length_10171_cov_4.306295_8_plen_237_part_00